jgi:hypothetical protein
MQLFFTGADVLEGIQTNQLKSLGGYKSSTVIPNSSPNKLFDDISNITIKNRLQQIRGIVLKNSLIAMTDLKMNVVYDNLYTEYNNECEFDFAFVELSTNGAMEKIPNIDALPYVGEFVSCESRRTDGILKVTSGGLPGDTVTILGVSTAALTNNTIENVVDVIMTAFAVNVNWNVIKKSSSEVYFQRKIVGNNNVTDNMTTSGITATADPLVLSNGFDNSILLKPTFALNATLGIWVRRTIKESNPNSQYNKTCDQVNDDYANAYVPSTIERTTINFDWL